MVNYQNEIILITTLYEGIGNHKERLAEIEKCTHINLENKHIREIVVFFEHLESKESLTALPQDFEFFNHSKINIKFVKDIPTFKFLFEFANKHYPQNYIVVHNADIFFSEKLSNLELVKKISSHKSLWFLARYSYQKNLAKFFLEVHERSFKKDFLGNQESPLDIENFDYNSKDLLYYPINISIKNFEKKYVHKGHRYSFNNDIKELGSADSYCFYAPIYHTDFDYKIGTPGCDSFLMKEAQEKGLKIQNPSLSTISFHLHADTTSRKFTKNYKFTRLLSKLTYLNSIVAFYNDFEVFIWRIESGINGKVPVLGKVIRKLRCELKKVFGLYTS